MKKLFLFLIILTSTTSFASSVCDKESVLNHSTSDKRFEHLGICAGENSLLLDQQIEKFKNNNPSNEKEYNRISKEIKNMHRKFQDILESLIKKEISLTTSLSEKNEWKEEEKISTEDFKIIFNKLLTKLESIRLSGIRRNLGIDMTQTERINALVNTFESSPMYIDSTNRTDDELFDDCEFNFECQAPYSQSSTGR